MQFAKKEPSKSGDGNDPLKGLIAIVGKLVEGQQSTTDGMKTMQDTIAAMPSLIVRGQMEAQQRRGQEVEEKDPLTEMTDEELKELSPKELIQLGAQSAIHGFKSELKPLQDKIKAQDEKLSQRDKTDAQGQRRSELKEARSSFKDLDEWDQEILDKLEVHPTLSITEAYNMVRSGDKAEEMDKKYKLGEFSEDREKKTNVLPFDKGLGLFDQEETDAEGNRTITTKFGGLSPSDVPDADEKPIGTMKFTDAASKAYNEVAARHPEAAALLG